MLNTGIGGSGLLSAPRYIATPRETPDAPTLYQLTAGDGEAKVCWQFTTDTDPVEPGIQHGSTKYPAFGWQYSKRTNPADPTDPTPGPYWEWLSNVGVVSVTGNLTNYCGYIYGLTNGETYYIWVQATGKSGDNYPDMTYPFLARGDDLPGGLSNYSTVIPSGGS